ncbi:DPYS [Bugula neritina]|uniref:DPYS n=1 Tax=Bugula neritina TaxID=10212 RepID=A0A7J7JJI3_BUGNE|nr:DPYS [Bugula neritina]
MMNNFFYLCYCYNFITTQIIYCYYSAVNDSIMEEVIVSSVVNELAAKPSISDNGQDELAECLHIIGGTCVNDDQVFEADIIVENGLIKEIGPNLTTPDAATVVDAKGMLVLPGGIDTNTHFQLPVMGTVSADDFYSGQKQLWPEELLRLAIIRLLCIINKTMTSIDCVWDSPTTSLLEAYDKWKVWADSKVACNYGLSVGITKWDKTVADEMEVLVREKGVNTFRVSQEYKGLYMLDDGELLQVFSKCKELGALVTTLSENGHVIEAKAEELIGLGITGPEGHAMCRAEEVEAEAVNRAIVLANQARCPLAVVPITSKSSAKVISEARRKGYVVFGGSVAASLGVDGSHYWNQCWRHAAAYVTVPPLRPDPTVPAYLMEHLSSIFISIYFIFVFVYNFCYPPNHMLRFINPFLHKSLFLEICSLLVHLTALLMLIKKRSVRKISVRYRMA